MMNIQFFNFLNFDGARRWCPVALGSRYGSVTAIWQEYRKSDRQARARRWGSLIATNPVYEKMLGLPS
jgi:hypothetical protein